MTLKINISKAYDRVDYGYLRGMLLQLGLHPIFVSWIWQCITLVRFFVSVNDDVVVQFIQRGVFVKAIHYPFFCLLFVRKSYISY